MFSEDCASCDKSLLQFRQFAELWDRELFLNVLCLHCSNKIVDLFPFLAADSQYREHSSQEFEGPQGMEGISVANRQHKCFKGFEIEMLALKIDELYQQERSLAHYGKDEVILVFPLKFLLFRLEMTTVVLNHLLRVCIFGAIPENSRQNRVLRIEIQPSCAFFDHNIPQVLCLFESS